ncbi:MAG: D-arabinono-1,4-lactone oxidase [Microbacteriaceae bacterium]
MVERNWSGTHEFAATTIHNPSSIIQAQEVVARSSRVRPLGTRHSFNEIADGVELISLVGVAPEMMTDGKTVTVTGGTNYATLAEWLEARGLALHNMGSLPHISVAGAISTATHGSGSALGNLSTAVRALELITPDGTLETVSATDNDFPGAVVALGLLGPIARVTLAVQPSFQVRQDVFSRLEFSTLLAHVREVFAAGYSVSVFTDWVSKRANLWVKSRTEGSEAVPDEIFGAKREYRRRELLEGNDNMTVQGGLPGPWSERLPHFRIDATPSNGDEIQTEYLVAIDDAAAALTAVQCLAEQIAPILLITELRTVAADDLWLSTAYGRDTLCIHFTWKNLPAAVLLIVPLIEVALAPFAARPHWGKVHQVTAPEIDSLYDMLPNFRNMVARRDPNGTFTNAYLTSLLGLGDS